MRFELSLLILVVALIMKIRLTILIRISKVHLTTRLADQSGARLPLRSISLLQLPIVSLENPQRFPSTSLVGESIEGKGKKSIPDLALVSSNVIGQLHQVFFRYP